MSRTPTPIPIKGLKVPPVSVAKGGFVVKDTSGNEETVELPQMEQQIQEEPVKVSSLPSDKLRYMQSIQTGARMKKEYLLFDSKMKVVFRELSPIEENLVIKQLEDDVGTGECRSAESYRRLLSDYRVVSLMEGFAKNGEEIKSLPTISTAEFDKNKFITVLPQRLAWIQNNWIQTETIRKAILLKCEEFEELLSTLAAAAGDPAFFSKIPSSDS